ncbi:MAG: MBL fold metallo-hydrolase [Chloroflexi bacterium]|nr:MBL fold metallo-hydrolase [Chloroflexota bacterium]
MPTLTILGTSYSVPDENHENTHMVLAGKDRRVLIDCVSNPIVRLKKAGLRHEDLTDIIMTHFHPDHVSGVPLLLMGMGLLERRNSLDVYGLKDVVTIMEKILQDYQWKMWHHFSVKFHRVREKPMQMIIDTDEFRIYTSPVVHFVPTIGVRIEFKQSGKVLAYTCDTAPNPIVIALANDADILIHEAAGASEGHSSPEQAGEVARQANAKHLYLIHYPTGEFLDPYMADKAAKTFDGPITIAEDFMTLEFD